MAVAGLDHTKFCLINQFQTFLFIVVIVISILLKTTFSQISITIASYWWKFYSDRTRTKPLLRRLKNIGMAYEKLYRNTNYFDFHKWCQRHDSKDTYLKKDCSQSRLVAIILFNSNHTSFYCPGENEIKTNKWYNIVFKEQKYRMAVQQQQLDDSWRNSKPQTINSLFFSRNTSKLTTT